MNIRNLLTAEHSKKQCLKVVEYVGNNAVRFKQLVEVFLEGPYRLTQRAAWPLGICVEQHPQLLIPHLSKMIAMLKRGDVHDAVKRNILRGLQYSDTPSRFDGQLLDIGFQLLIAKDEPVAVKVFAISVVHNIIMKRKLSDLELELVIILEDQLPYSTAAFQSRAQKVLRLIKSRTS